MIRDPYALCEAMIDGAQDGELNELNIDALQAAGFDTGPDVIAEAKAMADEYMLEKELDQR